MDKIVEIVKKGNGQRKSFSFKAFLAAELCAHADRNKTWQLLQHSRFYACLLTLSVYLFSAFFSFQLIRAMSAAL